MTCTELAVEKIAPRADAPIDEWNEWFCQLEADSLASESERFTLLEAASARARSEDNLAWAALAIRAAVLLANYDGGRYRHIAELEAMRLRVRFLVKLGSRPGDPVLDHEKVADWFIESLPFCSCVAKKMTARIDGDAPLSAGELRTLHQVGVRLALVQQLAECGELPRRTELSEWLAIDDLLS